MNLVKKISIFFIAVSFLFASCEAYNNSNKTQRAAVIGGVAGGILGAILGNNVGSGGNSELGAVLGTVVGGAAGAIIGNQMDKQAQIQEEIPGAEVKRVDDGIVVTFDENSGVTFAVNKAILTDEAKTLLNKLVNILREYPDTNVLIAGHTDSTGSDALNMALSEKRAKAVTAYFENAGLASSRFTTKWYGETQPAYDNSTPEGRAKNRRVNIAIVPNEKMKEAAKQQAGQ